MRPPSPMQYIELKLVNQQGQNLIFGDTAIYALDSIQILKNYNNFSINNASVRRSFNDSFSLRLDFYVPEPKSFIYYNQQAKTDTLEINWSEKTGKCCNAPFTYYSINGVKFNGLLIQPKNGIYYFVK